MLKYGLISNYTIKNCKDYKAKSNEENIENIVNRKFNQTQALNVVVSDLTYVNVGGKCNSMFFRFFTMRDDFSGY